MKAAITCILAIQLTSHLAISAAAQNVDTAIDLKIGRMVTEKIEPSLPILREKQINEHVQKFGALVARSVPERPYFTEFKYTFKVLDTSEVAIFAVPGGAVYLSRGLLAILQNEGQLVGIMAHAVAHIAMRDYAERLRDTKDPTGQDIESGIRCSFSPSGSGCFDPKKHKFRFENYMLTFTHVKECGTDLMATEIIALAGYDPDDLGTFLQDISFKKIKAGSCFNGSYLPQRVEFVYHDAEDLRQRKVYDRNNVPYMSREFLDFINLVKSLPQ